MTKQEEARRRAAVADRDRKELKPEDPGLPSAFYSAFSHAEESASCTQAQ